MSVPVRYSAAANHIVVDSGLYNTLQQEEQYHHQLQQQPQNLFCPLYNCTEVNSYNNNNNNSNNNNNNSTNYYCMNNSNNNMEQQQQLMQQRSSMSSSVLPSLTATTATATATMVPANANANIINNSNMNANNFINCNKNGKKLSTVSQAINNNDNLNAKKMTFASVVAGVMVDEVEVEVVDEEVAGIASLTTTSATATLGAAINNDDDVDDDVDDDDGNNDNAEMRTEWMSMSDDEGRFGTPGAAGLEYQKYEIQQQQQQHVENQLRNNSGNGTDLPMEPSLMDKENIDNSNVKNLENKLNAMTSDELYNTLKEYDALQDKYHTVLLLPKESKREVTAGGRDGSAYVLRCLKMWYELPSDVLFSAMSLVDRFLDRMAVKPKHMACMSVASFHLAIKQLELKPIPAEDLVKISQCGCTAGDLERMAGVIANKLGVQMGHTPITSVSYLRIYYALFRNLAKEIGGQFFEFYQQLIKLEELENRLEILLCDVKTTVITPSTLALVLICLHLDFHIKESYTRGSPELKHVFEYILFLQQYMRIPDRVFTCGFSIVSGILSHYNGQNKQPYKQRLVWKLSNRTLRVLRPINRFSSDLPTIQEGTSNAMDDGCRSRTESISSEEEEDWPTSPIIPIFEQC